MKPVNLNSISSLPGRRNDLAVYPEIFDPMVDELIQFSIDSQTGMDFCEIFCFNVSGQAVYHHTQNVFSYPSFVHFWNGKMDNGSFPARGIYLIMVVAHLIDGETVKFKGTFVIK